MIATNITTTIITNFDKVNRRLARKERNVLVRTGAFARKVMRGNIRRRKSVSEPGGYPHAHVSGNAGMKLILFNARPAKLDVVIGPLYFRSKGSARGYKLRGRHVRTVSRKTVPQLLNEGGTSRRITRYDSGIVKSETHRYRPRPFRELTRPKAVAFMKKRIAEKGI